MLLQKLRFILTLIVISSSLLLADERDFEVSLFGNLGLVSSDSDLLGYRTDVSVPDGLFDGVALDVNTKLGVQFSHHFDQNFDFVGQFLYRNETTDSLDELTQIAFLRYQVNENWSIRLGRTPLDLFMFTEYRDVDSALPWAILPTEVYGLIPTRKVDGMDILYSHTLEDSEFRIKAYYGDAEFVQNSIFGTEDVYALEPIYGTSLEWSAIDWLVTMKFAHSKNNSSWLLPDLESQLTPLLPIWPTALSFINSFSLDNFTIDYIALGGRYDADAFSFYAELTKLASKSVFVRDIYSGYLSAVYHQGEYDYFVGYSKTHSREMNIYPEQELIIPPQAYPAGIDELFYELNTMLNSITTYQETVFAGISWHINDHWTLKAQAAVTNVKPQGEALWKSRTPNIFINSEEQVNTLFINLSFNF